MILDGPPLVGVGDLEQDHWVDADTNVNGGHFNKKRTLYFVTADTLADTESDFSSTVREKKSENRQDGR